MAEMSNGLALHSTVSLIKQPEIISTTNIFLSDNNIRYQISDIILTSQTRKLSSFLPADVEIFVCQLEQESLSHYSGLIYFSGLRTEVSGLRTQV